MTIKIGQIWQEVDPRHPRHVSFRMITREIAQKIIETVDVGLARIPMKPGERDIEYAVCYALGYRVAPTVRTVNVRLNDAKWSSKAARAKGLRRLAVLQLDSDGAMDEVAFVRRLLSTPLVVATGNSRWPAGWAEAYTERAAVSLSDALDVAHYVTTMAAHSADDAALAKFADDVADILIDMQVPGVQWLELL